MSDAIYKPSGKTVSINCGALEKFNIHFMDLGQGKPVVMLHGSGPGASGLSNFIRNIDAYVASGHRVILIDMPGWGYSDTIIVKNGNRVPINVDALLGVLDHLGIDRVSLVGNSMGGATALNFSIRHPSRVDKLVIMGGGGGGQSMFVPMPSEGIKLLNAAYRQPTLENLKRMLGVFLYDSAQLTDDMVDSRFDMMKSQTHHIDSFVASMDVNPKHLMADFADQLSGVKAKTLVVWGRDDRCVPLDAGLRLTWALPDAQLHVFSRCGHWAQWEHADEFNNLTICFLRDQGS